MTAASATGGEGRKPSSAGGSGSGSSSDGQGSSLEGGSAASPPSSASFPPRQQLMALLPPLPLYRRLLRAHRRHLPPDMRLLGDEYIRSEFRSHREVENPVHIIGFLTEWQLYAQKIEGDSWMGDKIDPAKIEKMSDEQIGQLYELMNAIQKRGHGDDDTGK